MAALVGTEILYVNALDTSGALSATLEQTTTGAISALGGSNPVAPTVVAATATAAVGSVYLLGAATGSVLTLPAASGTGGVVRVIVKTTVTSNFHKVLAASSSDNMQGNIITQVSGTCTGWNAAIAATIHSLRMNGSTTGGFQGDYFELRDVAANVWEVTGLSLSSGTAATPFNTSTT